MPDAGRMLLAYQAMLPAARRSGNAGVGRVARLERVVTALLAVVNDDYERELEQLPGPYRMALDAADQEAA